MSPAASHPLWQELLGWLLGLPLLALLLQGLVRGLLASAGIGGRAPLTRRRLALEWVSVLAFLYAYAGYSAIFPHQW